MKAIAILCVFTALPMQQTHAGDSDILNERLSASFLEREAHWRVDCEVTWSALQAARPFQHKGEHCQIGEALKRSLQLCAFIYQPPGESPHFDCPDYQGVLGQLEKPCSELTSWLDNLPKCSGR